MHQLNTKISNVKNNRMHASLAACQCQIQKKQSCHPDCDQNKNNSEDLNATADTDTECFKVSALKKVTYNLLICKNLLKYLRRSTSGVSQLPESACCTCQWGPLPASAEAARENAPHSSSLAKHSGPGWTGSRWSSGPCPSHTPYTWPHCPWCKVYKSIPSERKGI